MVCACGVRDVNLPQHNVLHFVVTNLHTILLNESDLQAS